MKSKQNRLSKLPTTLSDMVFSFFSPKELGVIASVSGQFKHQAQHSCGWKQGIKKEFRNVVSLHQAKELFLTYPSARLVEYLLIDKVGRQYLADTLLPTAWGSEKEDVIKELIKMQDKGVFANRFIAIEQLLNISPLGLYVINDKVFNEHGLAAFKKGFINASDFISFEWRSKPGFLKPLFTPEGIMALETGRITTKQVLECRHNEDVGRLIQKVISAPISSVKP